MAETKTHSLADGFNSVQMSVRSISDEFDEFKAAFHKHEYQQMEFAENVKDYLHHNDNNIQTLSSNLTSLKDATSAMFADCNNRLSKLKMWLYIQGGTFGAAILAAILHIIFGA